ncbi:hypothetical protein G1H11_16360 [Phytoactinopolyspora alkaliphila]|uniref:Uncharacterized protein n=1 Tax=Phytoactinopolyspora alkaliphila TaxID=1783498 RepID=A0A6N9YPM1_9ACTN|nr:hypothetical protein [Phytoactinopolyspora alkaliphila]NED96880.1 hypothetical protein [Phytoactinopolyspora alkaliphila]
MAVVGAERGDGGAHDLAAATSWSTSLVVLIAGPRGMGRPEGVLARQNSSYIRRGMPLCWMTPR